MRAAGGIAASILDELTDFIKVGVSTAEIDRRAMELIVKHGVESATVGYRGYRHATCVSVNEVICHGVPGGRRLKDGDIVNVDVTIIKDGWHGDSSRMYTVGEISRLAARLIKVTHDALMLGIAQVGPGATFGDIGAAIQRHAFNNRMAVVHEFCGHGIGRTFHLPPNVLHFGKPGRGQVLREGMFFTIEPMINLGSRKVVILKDGWTAVTRDGSLSAQFEHTVGVTDNGCEIFTHSTVGNFYPDFVVRP